MDPLPLPFPGAQAVGTSVQTRFSMFQSSGCPSCSSFPSSQTPLVPPVPPVLPVFPPSGLPTPQILLDAPRPKKPAKAAVCTEHLFPDLPDPRSPQRAPVTARTRAPTWRLRSGLGHRRLARYRRALMGPACWPALSGVGQEPRASWGCDRARRSATVEAVRAGGRAEGGRAPVSE